MSRVQDINPAILAWARETAGLTVEEAADRLGFANSTTATATERLLALESGEQQPTRAQLTKFAAQYRRPLITFYLKEPPAKGERGEDFRKAAATVTSRENALLDAVLRDVRARQEMIRDLLEDEDDFKRPDFVGSLKLSQGVPAAVQEVSRVLRFDNAAKSLRKGDGEALFKDLRRRAETAGVFVLLIGNLGSHHSNLRAEVFRGYALADNFAPFIVINDQDARPALAFTLIHELAHILLGESGVSGNPDTTQPHSAHESVERFCNDVAGEFLLPTSGLGSRPSALVSSDLSGARSLVSLIAREWSVSEPMVAYRLNRIDWITADTYGTLIAEYRARWQAAKQKVKDEAGEDDTGPSYYVVKQSKLGNALIEIVSRNLRDNSLTHTKAAKLLGVKTSSVEPLLRGFEKNGNALFQDAGR